MIKSCMLSVVVIWTVYVFVIDCWAGDTAVWRTDMSRTFKTDYQALSTFDDEANDDELDVPPSNNVVHIRPDQSRGQLAFDLGLHHL